MSVKVRYTFLNQEKYWLEFCISGWNHMLQPYIEHSLMILMMKKCKNFRFLSGGRMDYQRLGGPRNVSIDLKNMMFCAFECLCTAHPLESG